MSADSYSTCPNCVKIAQQKRDEAIALLDYGETPEGVYRKAVAEAYQKNPDPVHRNMREDYEFFANDGVLEIEYHAECSDCKFRFHHRDYVPMMPEG